MTTEPERNASAKPDPPRGPVRRWLRARPADVIDLFVYVIVLKTKVITRLHGATTHRAKIAAGLSLWVVAAGSKLVVLALVDLVFGQSVSLGGFIPVTLLVMALLLSRAAVRRLLYDTPTAI